MFCLLLSSSKLTRELLLLRRFRGSLRDLLRSRRLYVRLRRNAGKHIEPFRLDGGCKASWRFGFRDRGERLGNGLFRRRRRREPSLFQDPEGRRKRSLCCGVMQLVGSPEIRRSAGDGVAMGGTGFSAASTKRLARLGEPANKVD